MAFSWQEDGLAALSVESLEWSNVPLERVLGTRLKGLCYVQGLEVVYMCGGADESTSAKAYSFDGQELHTLRPMLQARMEACGVLVSDYLYIFGGYNQESEVSLRTCERFSLETLRWTSLPVMNEERRLASACVLGAFIYLVGGYSLSTIEIFSTDSQMWSDADISLSYPLAASGLYAHEDSSSILVLGGKLDNGTLSSAVYRMNLIDDTVTLEGDLDSGFESTQSLIVLEDSRLVLICNRQLLTYDMRKHERRKKRLSTIGEKTQIKMDEVASSLSKELASRGIMGLSRPEKNVTVTLPHHPLVFVVKRAGRDDNISNCYQTVIADLLDKGARVLVEQGCIAGLSPLVRAFDLKLHNNKINLVVTLGGDGTVIWAVKLFKEEPLPAILALHMGSLGFLTYYSVQEGMDILASALSQKELRVDLKKRLDIWTVTTHGKKVHKGVALNEVVIDRGSTGTLLHVDCYMNGEFFTTAFADGIMIATPSGSTAYSLAAGGSIVHHDIPCLLLTPICPHSLSFRPILFPEKVLLTFMIPDDARSSGMVSIDGGSRFELPKRVTLEVVISEYPASFISENQGLTHWMKQLKSTIKWNKRKKQKPLNCSPRPSTSDQNGALSIPSPD
jgi:NAD+ kinase